MYTGAPGSTREFLEEKIQFQKELIEHLQEDRNRLRRLNNRLVGWIIGSTLVLILYRIFS